MLNLILKLKVWLAALLIGGAVLAAGLPPANIHSQLQGKNAVERANIKADAIAKLDMRGRFTKGDYEIEITSPIAKIDGGIEFYAKALKNGQPVGFGKDGTVEIERFRFFQTPVLVPDGTTRQETAVLSGKQITYTVNNYKEDLNEAVRQMALGAVRIAGRDGSSIVKGKVGNTTDTFYTDSSFEDGLTNHTQANQDWGTLVAGAGTGAEDTSASTASIAFGAGTTSNKWSNIYRSLYNFNTGPTLPDGDNIDSATFSSYGVSGKVNSCGVSSFDVNLYSSNSASDNAIVAGDFNSLGSTAFSSAITYDSWDESGYNDFAMNASGLVAISKTGVTKLGLRNANFDAANSAPDNWVSGCDSYVLSYYNEQTGTTNDPKLVIVHAAPVASPQNVQSVIWFD